MSEELTEAPFLVNMGVFLTYKCQIACPHCVVEAGPHRKEEMKNNDILNWIKQTASYRRGHIKTACFTGGEPFYDINKLKKSLYIAFSNGLFPSVVTNAFWAGSKELAVKILESMPELRVISISADQYHQAEIPFNNVKNAILAAKELGLACDVAVCTEDQNDPEYKNMVDQLEQIIEKENINTVTTFPVGRALEKVNPSKYEMINEPPLGACGSANTPTIFPDGKVYACIGPVIDLPTQHPLYLGNLHEKSLAQILDEAELNVVLQILRLWGPSELLNLLEKKGFKSELPNKFIKNSLSNLCYTLIKDEKICTALTEMQHDYELMVKTAYARVYYLNETRMIELMEEKGLLDKSIEIIS